ncbi:MAG: Crp/Fnr family transcriptional regulator [Alphaproteobacteria bacterium]|nr:Crp/Fnr family transcriptional regulator [Alphaproteobacteria bacterium]
MAKTSLAANIMLAGLPADEIRRIEQACIWHRFAAGQQVLDRDSTDRDVYFVAEGRVEIVNYALSGREIAYAVVGAGGFFGELAAIDGEPRSANVVAAEACSLAALPAPAFLALMGRHASVALHVLERLARIVRSNNERIMDLATLGSVERVHRQLLRLARKDDGGAWVIDPLPVHGDIAGQAATTRETVARVLSQLRKSDLVRKRGKGIVLVDRAALQRLVERLGDGLKPGR